ncbi:hypothetical protein HBN50_00100 [Halobacteriovorax sp. GB3]|uniref:hypothetical protein n=1 Tax=Halobacteriovorax sp. GB3 TaxID=2719615 RepID=UPI002361A126|nr:hypothetical protein [Halobacteriovorax sp. GB3]MDD0851467.1 hypothetical protein [Halobacteriovorax sp. GB3]
MEKGTNANTSLKNWGLRVQVAMDLKRKLEEYRDPKVGVRLLAQKMEISERTLQRLINQENRPTYQTLFKIYRVLFNTTNDALLLEIVPEVIQEEIKKHNPNKLNKSVQYLTDIESEILYDRCFCEIYFMAACSPLSKELVQYRYGLHGVETLEKMIELQALKQTKEGLYILGANQTTLSANTLKRVGLSLTEKFSKPTNTEVGGENLIAFFAEGLSEEAYDEWLQVDERAFREKVKIAQKSKAKGDIRAFTYMVTDTMSDK